jgi:fatty acid desaturase
MSITTSTSVSADETAMHWTLRESLSILTASTWRSAIDITFDWAVIAIATWTAYRVGNWATLPAIVVIGNRQRALGNLLHESSHQNLSPHSRINDMMAQLLLAAPLFVNLTLYRRQHARHHAWLGQPSHDPDFIACKANKNDRWFDAYFRILLSYPVWIGSLLGHLFGKRLSHRQWIAVVLWWGVCETLVAILLGTYMACLFFMLWMIARGTVFHAITTFREMTDHYGLSPTDMFQYTREIPTHGFASILLHPHYNGYHLTHHLFPHIPYYHLPRAHALLTRNPMFSRRAIICRTYLGAKPAGISGWGVDHV